LSPLVKKVIQYTVIFAIGFAFIYFVFNRMDWNEMVSTLKKANYNWIAVGLGISIVSHWMRAYRATLLYSAMNYKVSTMNSLYAVFIGYFVNYIIPRGGEVSRCASLYKTDDVPVEKGLGTVVVERVFDMLITVLILGLVVILQFDVIYNYIQSNLGSGPQGSGNGLKYALAGSLVVFLALIVVFRKKLAGLSIYKKLVKLLEGFLQGFTSVREVRSPVLFILLSAGIWACYILMMYVCLFSLDATDHLNFVQCLTVFALGTIGVVIPAPGAGAGTYHYAIMQGLLLYNVTESDGTAYAVLVHGSQMVMFLVLGGISSLIVLFKSRRNKASQTV
jgi:glycosyltransferase 2 family protein